MLTAQQIVTLACDIAKTPGMLTKAGQMMNARLVQIALEQDLDVIRRTAYLSAQVGQNSYNLPANYLRAREVFYNIDGAVFYLDPTDLRGYDKLFNGPGVQQYPYLYATDISTTPPTLFLYPAPAVTFTFTVRYMDNLVEITSPETSSVVPWFQDQLLLINMVAEDMMNISDDARVNDMYRKNDERFTRYLRMANDQESICQKVTRDPRTFRTAITLKPTKKTL